MLPKDRPCSKCELVLLRVGRGLIHGSTNKKARTGRANRFTGKSRKRLFPVASQCGKARQSRIFPARGTGLHVIPPGPLRDVRAAARGPAGIACRTAPHVQKPGFAGLLHTDQGTRKSLQRFSSEYLSAWRTACGGVRSAGRPSCVPLRGRRGSRSRLATARASGSRPSRSARG